MTPPPFEQFVTFLYTADLTTTAAFYEQILGLKLVLDQGSCRIYQVSAAAFLGFCQRGTAVDRETATDQSGVIVTLVSHHVDEWYRYLQAHDVSIEKPPTLYEKFNIYHLFIRDPNGYLVEIQTFLDPAWPSATTNTL